MILPFVNVIILFVKGGSLTKKINYSIYFKTLIIIGLIEYLPMHLTLYPGRLGVIIAIFVLPHALGNAAVTKNSLF